MKLTITERDLRRLQALTAPGLIETTRTPFPESVLQDLAELIPADDVGFIAFEPLRRKVLETQFLAPPDPESDHSADRAEIDATYWNYFWRWGLSRAERTGDLSAYRPADADLDPDAARALHRYYELLGKRHQVTVPFTIAGGVTRNLVFLRHQGIDFSAREVLLLDLIRPHLAALHADVERRRSPQLTARQRELLVLVSAGLTNRQVARQLGITEATVRTHLEHIYTTLGVTNRISAVRASRVLEVGLSH